MHRFLPQPAHHIEALDAITVALPKFNFAKGDLDAMATIISHAVAAQPIWPTFTGVATLVGSSPSGKVTVYYDATLGAPGLANAQDLIASADAIVVANNATFHSEGGKVNVIIFALNGKTNGQGGADHLACDYVTGQNLEVDADFGEPKRVHALFEAELSECSMNNFLCGLSTGEALSRWCAYKIAGNVLPDYATAKLWLIFGTPDYVSHTAQTDRDAYSTGCGVVTLSWFQSKTMGLGFPLDVIAPKMVALGNAGTFADIYAELTGKPKTDAYPELKKAITAAGGEYKLAGSKYGDDVFNALGAP
jgi:hypothetical protein